MLTSVLDMNELPTTTLSLNYYKIRVKKACDSSSKSLLEYVLLHGEHWLPATRRYADIPQQVDLVEIVFDFVKVIPTVPLSFGSFRW